MEFYTTQMSTLFIFLFSVVNQWTGVEGWSYHYSNTTMDWVTSRKWCTDHYTDMVAIQNRDEIEYLNNVIPKATTGYYWIGIRKINGTWTWVGTNKHLTAEAENWAQGEPNNGGNNEDCVEMYIKRGRDDGKWNDELCKKMKSALCYTASCQKDSCSPNGECVETINSHYCKCSEGFYGDRCEHVVRCEKKNISDPEHGRIQCSHVFETFSYKSKCEYSCDEGYQLVGATMRECGANKEWSDIPPTCELVRCPALKTPQDGNMSCTDQIFSFGSVCSFICSEGFILEGASITNCTKTGEWSTDFPKCTAVQCPALKTPQDGSVSCTSQTPELGSVCSFTCNDGFILEGAPTTECTKTGEWNADVPKCTVVQCPALEAPQDGSVSCTSQTPNLGSICRFSCSEGFILEGASRTECKKTGEWSTDFPKCTAVQCPTLETPQDGSMSCTDQTPKLGSVCSFTCSEGFILEGAPRTECTKTGEWSADVPKCTVVQCPALKTPQNGRVSCTDQILSFGSVCSFNCSEGFIMEGAPTTECTKTGEWNADVPKCTVVQCPALEAPQDGSVSCTRQTPNLGSICRFSCSEGFILEGASITECTQTGEWSMDLPKCTAVQCPTLETPQDGNVSCTDQTPKLGSVCSFTCSEGFILEGAPRTECAKTGEWSADVPKCTAVRCPYLQEPINGLMNCSSEESIFNTSCYFSCLNGYELQGHYMVMCTLSGNWTGEVPKCQAHPVPFSSSLVSGVTIGVGGTTALSSLFIFFWIMKKLSKLKAKKFDLSNSDIDVPSQQYKLFDSVI